MTEFKQENVPRMVPIREAAKLSGLSYDFIRRECLQGRIIHIRAGSKYLLNLDRLIEYLNTGDGGGNT